jgi:hypothetical protein
LAKYNCHFSDITKLKRKQKIDHLNKHNKKLNKNIDQNHYQIINILAATEPRGCPFALCVQQPNVLPQDRRWRKPQAAARTMTTP